MNVQRIRFGKFRFENSVIECLFSFEIKIKIRTIYLGFQNSFAIVQYFIVKFYVVEKLECF